MFFGIHFIPFFALILFDNIDNKIRTGIVVYSFIISICFSRMAGDAVADGQTFSTTVGLLYVFNLIVGTGALALPSAFQAAGYVLGIILLFISAFTSYVCATFILESMAIANCMLRRQFRFGDNSSTELTREGETSANRTTPDDDSSLFCAAEISPDFAITKRVELSEMAHLFLGRAGTLFAYFVLIVYLFGDLAVYSSTVPKSLMNVLCSSLNSSSSPSNFSIPCHSNEGDLLHEFSRFAVYQFCILAFLTFCLPMVLMGMTKTKWLQLVTTLCRWTAFLLMILMASVQLAQNGPKGSPSAATPRGFASLFGVAVYAFMCHHSIPGLVTPIRDKSNLSAKLVSVYALIYLFYCALSLSGSFAFTHVQDIYTINFLHDDQTGGFWNALLDYFLALFPVFVLTSSYIIVAITLSNNVRVLLALILGADFGNGENAGQGLGGQSHQNEQEALLSDEQTGAEGQEEDAPLNFHSSSQPPFPPNPHSPRTPSSLLRQFGIPFVVVAIPGLLSLMTDNVLLLASITGSFPGVGVQFVLPALLILGARRALSFRVGCSASLPPQLRSPFSHWFWPFGILCWAFLSIIVVSLNIFHLGA